MGHGHAHAPPAGNRRAHRRVLLIALCANLAYTVGEAVAGLVGGSLALLADAGHNLSDVAALGVALLAAWLADRPPTPRRSYGLKRAEILAALANGVALVAVSIWIFIEAAQRLADPPAVDGWLLVAVAGVGLAINLATGLLLWRFHAESLNMRAASLHLLGDAAASLGVVVAGVVVLATGWVEADPIVALAIGVLVLASSWTVLRESVGILLEEAPRGIDPTEVGARMASAPGVVEVHDLHVWEITSGFPALSAHVLVASGDDCHARRRELEELLAHEFGIAHTTLQVDHASEHGGLVRLGRFDAGGFRPA